jgi:hypothetical protein
MLITRILAATCRETALKSGIGMELDLEKVTFLNKKSTIQGNIFGKLLLTLSRKNVTISQHNHFL